MRRLSISLAVLAVLGLVGCTNQDKAVREDFSRQNTCPMEQVQAKRRADVRPSALINWPAPPGEIVGDPARVALWEKNQQTQKEGYDRPASVYEVKGCGKHFLTSCTRTKPGLMGCNGGKTPPGVGLQL